MDNTQEKNVSFFRFEDLRIYAKATDYSTWIINNIGHPENDMQRNLVNSFCHSSYIRECIVYTAIAFNTGLFDEDKCNQSREFLMELTRMIGALIISLQRGSSRRHEEYDSDTTTDDTTSDIDNIDTNF